MLILLYFQGEGVFILKKEDDEEPIKVGQVKKLFSLCLVLVFKMHTCMVFYNISYHSC